MDRVPFDAKEIANKIVTPSTFPGWPPSVTFDTPISPKENYRLLYERKIPFWLPVRGDTQMITPRIDPDNLARVFAFEAQPMTDEDRLGDIPRPDKFGVPWVFVEQVGGSMVEPGNPVLKDVNDWQDVIQFPDLDSWDWAGSIEANKDWVNTDKWFSFCLLTGFFERLISFMDFENAAVALVDDDQKDAVHSLFDALVDCYCDILGRSYNAYKFDALNLHDDWGAQRAPFFSLDVAMEMIVPHLKKVVDFAHNELGVYFDMHSCGKNELLVPGYIAAGCDSWSGQPMNDKHMIYDKYGDKLILGIELDATYTMGDPPLPLDVATASAQRFIDKFVPNFKEKPVIMGGLTAEDGYSEWVYETTRNALNDLAAS